MIDIPFASDRGRWNYVSRVERARPEQIRQIGEQARLIQQRIEDAINFGAFFGSGPGMAIGHTRAILRADFS